MREQLRQSQKEDRDQQAASDVKFAELITQTDVELDEVRAACDVKNTELQVHAENRSKQLTCRTDGSHRLRNRPADVLCFEGLGYNS